MKTLDGKNNEAIIFTDEVIDSIVSTRITDLLNTKMTNGLVVRIMPNVCSSFNNITGYSFVVRHDQPDTNPKAVRANSYRFNGTKTMARPVRPIKE